MRRQLANPPNHRSSDTEGVTNGSDTNGDSTTRPFHLCILAITIIDLHQAAIWQEWAAAANAAIANTDTSSDNNNDDNNGDCPIVVSLIGHTKHPDRVRNDWFRSKLLLVPPERNTTGPSSRLVYHTRRPEWGSIEITQAMMDLARKACRIGTASSQDEHDVRYSRERYRTHGPNGTDTTRSGLPPVDCVMCTLARPASPSFPSQTLSVRSGQIPTRTNHGYSHATHPTMVMPDNSNSNGSIRSFQRRNNTRSINGFCYNVPTCRLW